jgi:hypothetical protein
MSIFDRAKCLHDEHEWLLENSERLKKDKMVLDAKLREVIIFYLFSPITMHFSFCVVSNQAQKQIVDSDPE